MYNLLIKTQNKLKSDFCGCSKCNSANNLQNNYLDIYEDQNITGITLIEGYNPKKLKSPLDGGTDQQFTTWAF